VPEVRGARARGTFLSWLDCRKLDLPVPACRVLPRPRQAGVQRRRELRAVEHQFVRLNFATSIAILDQILDRMGGGDPRRTRP